MHGACILHSVVCTQSILTSIHCLNPDRIVLYLYKYMIITGHGTFVGSMKLEPEKPTQIPLDSTLRFGASTRSYTLRERPQVSMGMVTDGKGSILEEGEGGTLLGLPELDNELDVRITILWTKCTTVSCFRI